MPEQELRDPLLLAVRNARPAIDDAALSPTSADALKMLEQVLQGEDLALAPEIKAPRGQQRILRRRNPASRRILRPRIGAIAIAALVAVAAVVIVLSGVSGGPSLVDRAYAAINAGDQVVHEVDTTSYSSPAGFIERVEGWLIPSDGRTRVIEYAGYPQARYVNYIMEWIITGTGRVYERSCLAYCRVGAFVNGRSAWHYRGPERTLRSLGFGLAPSILPGTFAQQFRVAYRAHAIVADGTTTFAGRRVARFQSAVAGIGATWVAWRPGRRPPSARNSTLSAFVEWYIDPASAQPVGFRVWGCTGSCARRGGPPTTTRIETFKRLDPTSQSLALLTGPGAPSGAR